MSIHINALHDTEQGMCTVMGTFGQRLVLARKAAGLGQADLMDAVAVKSRSQVSHWENDKAVPNGKYLFLLPGILGCSGHWLLTGEGPMTGPSNEDALRLTVIRRIAAGEVSDYELGILASPVPHEAAVQIAETALRIAQDSGLFTR